MVMASGSFVDTIGKELDVVGDAVWIHIREREAVESMLGWVV